MIKRDERSWAGASYGSDKALPRNVAWRSQDPPLSAAKPPSIDNIKPRLVKAMLEADEVPKVRRADV